MKKKNTKELEFSKRLLVQESFLLWIVTISFIALAFICVLNGYIGELPWLVAIAGFPWTAYGTTQAFYLRKSEKENTQGGIKYETVMAQYTMPITEEYLEEEFSEDAVG